MYYLWDQKTDEIIKVERFAVGSITDKRVAKSTLQTEYGEVVIYTGFLGIDHRHFGKGPPIVFETMMKLNGEWLDYQERYCLPGEAKTGHKALVNIIESGTDPRSI